MRPHVSTGRSTGKAKENKMKRKVNKKSLEYLNDLSTSMTSRFWECYKALKEQGYSSKQAYSEASRQLDYRPPMSDKYMKYHKYLAGL